MTPIATTLDMAPCGDGTCTFEIVMTGIDIPELEARKLIIDLMACAGEKIPLNPAGWSDKERWLPHECSDRAEAWLRYRKEYPRSMRTKAAVVREWYRVREVPA